MFANTMMGGVQMGFPDTCTTPGVAAGAPAPVPYPNIGVGATTIPPTNAMNVLVSCAPAQNQLTMGTISNGDNAGVMLGVASGMVMGPQGFTLGSLTVFMGGPPAQRLTSITKHNGVSMNDPGISAVPSQVKCLVLG